MLASKFPLQPTKASHQFNRRKQSYFFFLGGGGGRGGGLDVEYINAKNTTELQRFFHELEKFHYNILHAGS